ncbi:MAG: right-handed parallel beta-helix repeat-containing protein [Cellvibrionaceae bacterium]
MKVFKLIGIAVLIAIGFGVGKMMSGDTAVVISSGAKVSSGDIVGTIDLVYDGKIIEVKDGQLIQDAVKKASPGDTILVYPGTYKETVYIDKDRIRLTGVIVEGKWPTMEGEHKRNDAVLYSGNGITVENLKITHYKGNAIMGQAGNNFVIRNNWVIDTGVYGIFPQLGKNGLIEYNVLTGIEDAAIYVGMCDNVVVRFNDVYANVAGIEIENTRHSIVENNMVYNNTGGILAFITPGLPIKTAYDVVIRNNFVADNNHENFAAPGSIVSMIPPGTGIIVMAADDVIIENNIIRDNKNAGVIITSLDYISDVATDPDSEPTPDRVQIYDNLMANNGTEPIEDIQVVMKATFMEKGPDIMDNGSKDSCMSNPGAVNILKTTVYKQCEKNSTADLDYSKYLSATPVENRNREIYGLGETTYYGVCAGCHAYNIRMIGPPVMELQALYHNNPQGIADYIKAPVKRRDGYPAMPPQNYLDEETRLEAAKFMLDLKGNFTAPMGATPE